MKSRSLSISRGMIAVACCICALNVYSIDSQGEQHVPETVKEDTSIVSDDSLVADNEKVTDEALIAARSAVMQEADKIISELEIKNPELSDRPKTALNRLDEVDLTLKYLLSTMKDKGLVSAEETKQILDEALTNALEKNQDSGEDDFKVKTIRVPYVPDFIKQDIRDEVRIGLRNDVMQDVIGQAKHEQWGTPRALPAWVSNIKIKGDIRLRAQGEFYADKNAGFQYLDFLTINKKRTALGDDIFNRNTTIDRQRARVRARLAIDGKITHGLMAKIRFSTGSASDPVSTNQTLGNYGERAEILWDQVYLKYTDINLDGYNWATAYAGRMKNPWVSTDLLWDRDLGFEGFASQFRFNLNGGEDLMEMSDEDHTLFITLGAFALQEEALSSRDKWLFGGQIGTEWIFESQSKLTVALAYYNFMNINGEINQLASDNSDFTSPQFIQSGNTLVDISNSADPNSNEVFYALGGDYDILNINLNYDIAAFSPYHVILSADYVKNIGFNKNDIINKYGESRIPGDIIDKTSGYQIGLTVGWPIVKERGRWRVFTKMKYLESNAVLDAFTDSDFHGGGTDAKGFIIGGEYSMWDNSWFTVRWLSADEIDSIPLGLDILQVDLNAQF